MDSVAAFVDRWVAHPMFGDVPAEANALAERRTNTAAGLASSLRLAGTGTQTPLWDRLGELAMPVLVVTGGNDGKFTALGRRLVDGIGGRASLVVVGGRTTPPTSSARTSWRSPCGRSWPADHRAVLRPRSPFVLTGAPPPAGRARSPTA